MNTTFTVNKRTQSIEGIAKVLNECNMLLELYIEDKANVLVLHVETDELEMEYTEVNEKDMLNTLNRLKELVSNKDDIDELIQDLI